MNTTICLHQPVYYGVININIDHRTIGSIDIWRCGSCKKKFCEEKQLGIEYISDLIGMPKINNTEKWAISICKLQTGKHKWKLITITKDNILKHECLDSKILELKITDFHIIDNEHYSILVDDYINKVIEI